MLKSLKSARDLPTTKDELEGNRREQGDEVPAMRLIGSVMNWVLGLRPTYRFTRETAPDRLIELRNVCYTLLDDLHTGAGKGLQVRVDTAAGANEFWHMRPRLFDAVSEVHGEGVAAQRLIRLDAVLKVHHDRRSQFARGNEAEPIPVAAPPSMRRRRAGDDPHFQTTR
jgi:hypothetical protein